MPRSLAITLDADLPRRARSLGDGAIAQIFGGCYHENHTCHADWDCCPEQINDTGSGRYHLKCIGSSSGTMKWCTFV